MFVVGVYYVLYVEGPGVLSRGLGGFSLWLINVQVVCMGIVLEWDLCCWGTGVFSLLVLTGRCLLPDIT